jgi:GNAT superfamily N-acetyltransferase
MINSNLQLNQICSAEQYRGLKRHRGLPEFDLRLLSSHRPDAHWAVVDEDLLKARCSLWWRNAPTIPKGKAGLIGHYASVDDDSAGALLEFVSRQLATSGCTLAVGPMDQNTWRDYRFVTEVGDRPRFFLEPGGLPQWRDQFRRNGFREIAWYSSALVEDLTIRSPRLDHARIRMVAQGIRIRPLRRDQLDSDLKQIFAVVQVAFRKNPFYVPVSEVDFLEMYRPLQHTIPTDLILLAEQGDRVIGFCFAVPDMLQAKRGLPIDTVIVKTFGVLPQLAYAGLGQVLLEEVHHRAAASCFRYGIHALVRDAAHMERIVERYGIPFRRYALLGKELSR